MSIEAILFLFSVIVAAILLFGMVFYVFSLPVSVNPSPALGRLSCLATWNATTSIPSTFATS